MSVTTIARKAPDVGVIGLIALRNIVDKCAELRAQIDELTTEKQLLEAQLVESGRDTIDGTVHKVTISYGLTRVTVDWKAVAAKFKPSHQLVAAHTSEGAPYSRITYSARKLPA
jgi:hypothetical protein